MQSFLFYSVIILWCTQVLSLFAIFLLFRQFGQVYLSTGEGISRDGIPIGEQIPHVELFSLKEKKHVQLTSKLMKPTLISFISPSCKPCKELLHDWNEAHQTYGDELNMVTVILGEEQSVIKLAKNYAIQGETLWDPTEEVFGRFGVRVTPFAFAIDQNGVVQDKGLCGNRKQVELIASSIIKKANEKEGVEDDRSVTAEESKFL